jgi:hypothetical protein
MKNTMVYPKLSQFNVFTSPQPSPEERVTVENIQRYYY